MFGEVEMLEMIKKADGKENPGPLRFTDRFADLSRPFH